MSDIIIFYFSTKASFTLAHVFLILLIWTGAYFARKYSKNIIHHFFRRDQIKVGGKELATLSLVRQLINILAVLLSIQSLSFNNEGVGLTELLEYNIFEVDSFHVSIYNIILLFIFYFAARILNSTTRLYLIRALQKNGKVDEGKQYTVVTLAEYFIYTIFIIIAIESFGIDITILIASSAALFVGLGLGMQRIFADLISGFILLFEGGVKVGDIIKVEGVTVKVVSIHIRTTKVKTRDGNYLMVPNSKLTLETVSSRSLHKRSTRYSIRINVAYGSDTELVRQTLYDCALVHHLTDKKKPILVFLEDFAESALHFDLYFYTDNDWEVPRIKSDLRYLIDKAFREKGIKIPVPQREVYISKTDGLKTEENQ
ncbi:MAG: mechanosensitive ion channel family protein [Bacteroidota bacterium]